MTLRTKYTIFFGVFLVAIALGVAFYSQYVVGNIFKKQTTDNFRIVAEQTESGYVAYVERMKSRTVDILTDRSLRSTISSLVESSPDSVSRAQLAKQFSEYIKENEMQYDATIASADIVDTKGVVLASTNPSMIGVDIQTDGTFHTPDFLNVVLSLSFGETLVNSFVLESSTSANPLTHVAVPVVSRGKSSDDSKADAILVVRFYNDNKLGNVLAGSTDEDMGRVSSHALFDSYKTSDVYFVNSSGVIVTELRSGKNKSPIVMNPPAVVPLKISTLAVSSCLKNGVEINEEYDNYDGKRVLGASMCLESNSLVLILEVQKEEIFATLDKLIRGTTVGIILMFVLGVLVVMLFVQRPLTHINDIVRALEGAMKGDLNTTVEIDSKDETGRLATMFNAMIESIRRSQKELEISKMQTEEKAALLEKDVKEHQKQEKFLEESKRATLNLLEDSWKAKEKLEEEGAKLQTILASIGDGLILIDTDYKIVLVNLKAMEIFKVTQADLIGRDFRETSRLFKNKELLNVKDWPTEQVLINKKAVVSTVEENYSIATDGRDVPVPISFSISPLRGKFTGAVIVFRDITADRDLDEAKSGFISVASHQLRTPLTSIRWYSEMLLSEDPGPLNETQKDFMREVHGGAERLYKTVDLLLSISRVEGGKIKADRTPIDLGIFTRQIVKELTSQVNEKSLVLTVTPEDNGPVVVWLDEIILRQVILNILSNSIRYTNEGGFVKVSWKLEDSGRAVLYTVTDNGIGIPESQRSRIFSKFFRAENARAEVPDGSGLGLSLVKDLVESWGGKIWFETEEDKGSAFYFTIPLTTSVA